jgi:hypothetical protein
MATQTGTLQDLYQDVIDALQGRTDVTSAQVANYAAKAVREIAESYEFEELRTTGPLFAVTSGTSTYAVSNFMSTTPVISGSSTDDYSQPESFAVYVDYPNNSVVAPVRYKTPGAIETLTPSAVQGIPTWYTRLGSNFIIGPTPQLPYTMYMRYQAKHPFSVTSPTSLTEILYMPLTWYDILAYATAERIAVVKRWNDQAKYLHDILYGDPEYQTSLGKRGRPGLIAARLFQQERDEMYSTRSLTIMVGRTNPR